MPNIWRTTILKQCVRFTWGLVGSISPRNHTSVWLGQLLRRGMVCAVYIWGSCANLLPLPVKYHWNVSLMVSSGNYDLASQILSELDKNVPGLVMVNMRKISLERRKGNTAMAESLFQEYINNASQPEISSFFSIKFARYLLKVRGHSSHPAGQDLLWSRHCWWEINIHGWPTNLCPLVTK